MAEKNPEKPSKQAPMSTFENSGFTGEVNDELRPVDMAAALEVVADPGRALETLHWGRNYLYTVELETVAGPRVVVVKQFRNQGIAARLKRRLAGSKATKSWRAAWAVHRAGIRTPVPVLLAESVEPEGPSFYVSDRLGEFFESRYFFRALIAGNEAEEFPAIDRDQLIAALGTNDAPSIDLLVVNATDPIQWPSGTSFNINSAGLNGCLQLGGNPS